MHRKIVRKGKGHRYELIAGEIFFGLAALAMLLCAVLIPLEENVTYISGARDAPVRRTHTS